MTSLIEIFAPSQAHVEMLLESPDYFGMFRQFLSFFSGSERRTVENEIKDKIREVKSRFKRQDRIIWFLRLYRLNLLLTHLTWFFESDPRAKAYCESELQHYAKKSGQTSDDVVSQARNMATASDLIALTHYFSLPIPAIQSKIFAYDRVPTVFHQFQQAEKAWAEQSKGMVPIDPKEKPILKFPDGFAWYDLGKAYCPKEAEAMGHCGNAPSQFSKDRILSLRQTVKKDGRTFLKPYLTFILDEHGFLGEMKGRFNKKPEKEFHDKIVALLKLPIINGIKGGGYAAHNNFDLDDLPKSTREDVIEANPAFQPLWDVYAEEGMTPRVKARLEAVLSGHHVYLDIDQRDEDGDIIINKWSNYKDFVRDVDDDAVQSLFNIIEQTNDEELKHNLQFEIKHQDEIAPKIPLDYEGDETINQWLAYVRQKMYARVEKYLDTSYYDFYGDHQMLHHKGIDEPFILTISERDLVAMASEASNEKSGDFDDWEYGAAWSEILSDGYYGRAGWEKINWESVKQMRSDDGLITVTVKYADWDEEAAEYREGENLIDVFLRDVEIIRKNDPTQFQF